MNPSTSGGGEAKAYSHEEAMALAMKAYNEGFHCGSHWAMTNSGPLGWKDSRTKAEMLAFLDGGKA